MFKYLIAFIIFLAAIKSYSQMPNPAPTQMLLPNRASLEATFNLFYDKGNATSFVVNGSKGQYLITAKHVFGNAVQSRASVEIKLVGGKINDDFKCTVYTHKNPAIDIAVLKLDKPIVYTDVPFLGYADSYILGQECLFLGYPMFSLGSITDIGKVPLIKRAIISGFHEENNASILLLDGHNNPGFSGGPIITYNSEMNSQFIIGVVTGYINQPQDVELTIDQVIHKIKVNENSGIIISYGSEYISEIIAYIE